MSDEYRCPGARCSMDRVTAQYIAPLWYIDDTTSGGAWVVAADEPVCVRCGATLTRDGNAIMEPGAMLDFVSKL